MPGSKQACPNSAACWSPSTPETGTPSSTAAAAPRSPSAADPKRPAEGRTSGRVCAGTPKSVAQLGGPGGGCPCRRATCGWRWTGRWRRRPGAPVRFHSTQVSTVQKERSGCAGPSARSPCPRSQAALVALKYGSSIRPVVARTRGRWPASIELRAHAARCAGPARRWRCAAAARRRGRRRPGSRVGW